MAWGITEGLERLSRLFDPDARDLHDIQQLSAAPSPRSNARLVIIAQDANDRALDGYGKVGDRKHSLAMVQALKALLVSPDHEAPFYFKSVLSDDPRDLSDPYRHGRAISKIRATVELAAREKAEIPAHAQKMLESFLRESVGHIITHLNDEHYHFDIRTVVEDVHEISALSGMDESATINLERRLLMKAAHLIRQEDVATQRDAAL